MIIAGHVAVLLPRRGQGGKVEGGGRATWGSAVAWQVFLPSCRVTESCRGRQAGARSRLSCHAQRGRQRYRSMVQ